MLRYKRWALSAVLGALCLAANGQEKSISLNSSNAGVNPSGSAGLAFAISVDLVRADNNERVLPVVMGDNYFTLLKGETKRLDISYETRLLEGGKYKLVVTPYNSK